MTRVFFSQKTEHLIEKLGLIRWRENLQEKIEQNHQDMSGDWKVCALGDRITIKKLSTIWRN